MPIPCHYAERSLTVSNIVSHAETAFRNNGVGRLYRSPFESSAKFFDVYKDGPFQAI
jgi:hypothetical protein